MEGERMKPEAVHIEREYLKVFLDRASREPTSRELVERAKRLAKQELDELQRLFDEMFEASSPLVLSSHPIMKELKDTTLSSIRRYNHFISREYTKEEFENLPKASQADMRRILNERRAYLQEIIEKYGKY